ncbi:hypothetical protein [Streptomyces sp. NEAU-W12]|uniref:hypothetical protein n=1 Tax=Streptomyces sp. NEAU-W12 TaxID=2994668 RepID=UPI00224B3432|nr:hypothetical protein [Streptomyces sp. NEAU-W12]
MPRRDPDTPARPGHPGATRTPPAPPRFLPGFDDLRLSHAGRTRVLPHGLRGSTWRGNVPCPALLADGIPAGRGGWTNAPW